MDDWSFFLDATKKDKAKLYETIGDTGAASKADYHPMTLSKKKINSVLLHMSIILT